MIKIEEKFRFESKLESFCDLSHCDRSYKEGQHAEMLESLCVDIWDQMTSAVEFIGVLYEESNLDENEQKNYCGWLAIHLRKKNDTKFLQITTTWTQERYLSEKIEKRFQKCMKKSVCCHKLFFMHFQR